MADARNARSRLSRERFINPEQASVHLYSYKVLGQLRAAVIRQAEGAVDVASKGPLPRRIRAKDRIPPGHLWGSMLGVV